jgi:DNA end-binding protein Ku
MYYLLPEGAGTHEPYSVVLTAMEREERCGVGRIVFSGKDQVVLIRPVEGLLHMAMLNYDAEIKRPDKIAASLKKPSGISRQVKLAQTLVREWSDDKFDFAQYEDTYREKLEELIEAKSKGRELVAPQEEESPETISLMDALKKSLSETTKKVRRPSQKRRTQKRQSA